jgi:predicted lipoprotein with Yx(FWY)xxD motif
MRKLTAVLVLPAVLALVAGCGGSSSNSGASTSTKASATSEAGGEATAKEAVSSATEVSSAGVASLGQVLVDGEGKTLYVFAPDEGREVTCESSCAAVWPPLKIEAGQKASASGKVKSSLLGSDPDPEGGEVVTYAGWPLYTYVSDTEPGQAAGQGINLNGGYWYTITPAGKVVK